MASGAGDVMSEGPVVDSGAGAGGDTDGSDAGTVSASAARFSPTVLAGIDEELAEVRSRWARECLTMLSSELCVITIACVPPAVAAGCQAALFGG